MKEVSDIENKIFAVDFDGTLCKSMYPGIGEPIIENIEFIKKLKEKGNKIILWTCRTNKELEEAVAWCADTGLVFDKVNENLDESIEKYGGDTRKVYADFYMDDKNYQLSNSLNERKQALKNRLKKQI